MASHGRYTILGKLADGGMAEIFLAVQHGAEGFEKPVVLKRILTQYSADPQFRNMLLDEAHISMSLQHSNIVQILDLGEAGGRYFLALELVDGWDLERILQRARTAGMIWPAALGLYVTAVVCRALAYAHGKARQGSPLGIVHRDISPNNVLVSDQGEVKLTDFGIAKAQRKREQTAAGVIKGKVAYMSPEQALGGVVDRRSDIFSVGSMLYRMMTDRLPFEANNDLESLLKVQKAAFAPPEQARATVGAAVSNIIMRAMRLPPSERYQTADEMLADVERVLRNEFHSAGQTELKLWLEQLQRRDEVPTIGKQRLDTSGVVNDVMGTDLSAGTSFELDDLDKGSAPTELGAMRSGAPGAPPATGVPAQAAAAAAGVAAPRPETAKAANKSARRRSGFWLGVSFALAAVVGIRYLITWAEQKGVVDKLGLGDAAGPAPTVGPVPLRPGEVIIPSNRLADRLANRPAEAPRPAIDAAAEKAPAIVAAKGEERDGEAAKDAAKGEADDDEPDEEALLRSAVPNAESAVIGEDEGEGQAAPRAGGKASAGAKARANDKTGQRGEKGEKSEKGGPGAPVAGSRPETAILRFTSAPSGAVVRTKARVLGRTPINLHFKTDNSYDVIFVKRGYQPLTRRVTVHGTKDKKIAVTLKKKPAPAKHSFFHPHR